MKKTLIFIKNFILITLLIVYFFIVIVISTLLIARNDFNYSQFDDRVIVSIDDRSANEQYKENSIVVLKTVSLEQLEEGQEIFVYDVDQNTNQVSLIIEKVGKVNIDGTSSPHVTLQTLGTMYGQDYIAGVAYKTFPDIGKYISFLEGKWVFFGILVVPCFFILIYEIYLLIIAIKYDDYVTTNVNKPVNNAVPVTNQVPTVNQVPVQNIVSSPQNSETVIQTQNVNAESNNIDFENKLNDIENQIFNMNEQNNDKEKIQELMNQVQKLKDEYNSKQ